MSPQPPETDSASARAPRRDLFAAMTSPAGALLWLIVLAFSWGSQWPVMKAVLNVVDPIEARGIGVAAAGLLLLGICRVSGQPLRVARQHWRLLLVAAFFNITCWNILLGLGLSRLGAGRSAIIAYLMPVFSAVLSAVFLRERFTWRTGAALVLGLAALAVLVGEDAMRMGAAPLGPLLMLGAALVWALGTIPTKFLAPHVPPLTQVTWQMALGAVPLAGALLVSGGASLAGADAMVWTLIAANVAFGLVVPYLIWFALLGHLPASIASVCVLLSPCVGVISSALALGERVGVPEIVALGFVLAAIAIAVSSPGRNGSGSSD